MAKEGMPTQNEVIARIYCLSASILLGKATKDEIKMVGELAKKHDCFNVSTDEIKDCSRIISSISSNR